MLDAIAATVLDSAAKRAVDFLGKRVEQVNDKLLKEHEERQRRIAKSAHGRGPEIKDKFYEIKAGFRGAPEIVARALAVHVRQIEKWSKFATFSDLPSKKSISGTYIDLDTFVMPLRTHMTPLERELRTAITPALQDGSDHVTLLGQPGAGKTTSLQKLCSDYFRTGKALLNYNFPLLARLRDLQEHENLGPIFLHLITMLGIQVFVESSREGITDKQLTKELVESALLGYLDSLGCVLLLDGFDEISDPNLRSDALSDIKKIFFQLSKSKVILTSRSNDFPYVFTNVKRFEIAPLNNAQIADFASRWFQSKDDSNRFLSRLFASPYIDSANRPMTIAHLCAVFDRIGDIPAKPRSVYRKIVMLLLEEWDSQRDIKRLSKYGKFEGDRKFEFLSALAFELTTVYGTTAFNSATLHSAYESIYVHFELAANESTKVIGELESHTGLIVKSAFDQYEFAHKSTQEYLAAEYLVRLPSLAAVYRFVRLLPNELAIAVSLSSSPTEYLTDIIMNVVGPMSQDRTFFAAFAARLIQEGPVFKYTEDGAIAAVLLMVGCPEYEPLNEVFDNLFRVNAMESISRYYSVSSTSQNSFSMARRLGHWSYTLPDIIVLPKALVAITSPRAQSERPSQEVEAKR